MFSLRFKAVVYSTRRLNFIMACFKSRCVETLKAAFTKIHPSIFSQKYIHSWWYTFSYNIAIFFLLTSLYRRISKEIRVVVLLKYTEPWASFDTSKNSKNTCSPMCGFKSMYSRLMQYLIKYLMHYVKVVY